MKKKYFNSRLISSVTKSKHLVFLFQQPPIISTGFVNVINGWTGVAGVHKFLILDVADFKARISNRSPEKYFCMKYLSKSSQQCLKTSLCIDCKVPRVFEQWGSLKWRVFFLHGRQCGPKCDEMKMNERKKINNNNNKTYLCFLFYFQNMTV